MCLRDMQVGRSRAMAYLSWVKRAEVMDFEGTRCGRRMMTMTLAVSGRHM